MEGNQPKLHHLQSGYLLVTDTTHKELCTLPPLLFWVSQLVLPFLAGHRPSDSHVTHRDGSLQPPRPPGIPITGTHSGKPILPFPPTQPGWINLRQLAAFFPRKAVPRRRSRAASSPSHSAIQMPTVPTKILTLCHGRTARSGTGTHGTGTGPQTQLRFLHQQEYIPLGLILDHSPQAAQTQGKMELLIVLGQHRGTAPNLKSAV